MKTKLIYVIALVLFVQIGKAQTFGIKGGLNFANLVYSGGGSTQTDKAITGIHIGPVLDIPLQGSFNFNTGLLFSMKGSKAEGVNGYTATINYLDVPLNLAYKFAISEKSKFFIQAGPNLSYALSGKVKSDGVSEIIKFGSGVDESKRFDIGLGFGAGVEFGSIVASVNYQLGLADLDNYTDSKTKSKVFQISLAYMFAAKK